MADPKSSRDARAAERRLPTAEPEPVPLEAANEPETSDSSFDLQLGLHVIEAPLDTLPGELVEELLDQRAEPAAETGDGRLDIDLTFTLRPIDEAPAPGQAGRMPFWHGEYGARSAHLTTRLGELRRTLASAETDADVERIARHYRCDVATARPSIRVPVKKQKPPSAEPKGALVFSQPNQALKL